MKGVPAKSEILWGRRESSECNERFPDRLFRGLRKIEDFLHGASAPRRKSGVPICPDMRRANLFDLWGPRKIGDLVGLKSGI